MDNLIKERLVNCYIEFNRNDLRGACQNTQLQVTKFFQVIMRELEKTSIEESNN